MRTAKLRRTMSAWKLLSHLPSSEKSFSQHYNHVGFLVCSPKDPSFSWATFSRVQLTAWSVHPHPSIRKSYPGYWQILQQTILPLLVMVGVFLLLTGRCPKQGSNAADAHFIPVGGIRVLGLFAKKQWGVTEVYFRDARLSCKNDKTLFWLAGWCRKEVLFACLQNDFRGYVCTSHNLLGTAQNYSGVFDQTE